LESDPAAAVMVILYVPAGVPLGGVVCRVLLQAGMSKTSVNSVESIRKPKIRRRRRSPPIPTNAIPGTISQKAKKRRVKRLAAGLVTGLAVVVTFIATDAPLIFDKVTVWEGQLAAAGKPEQETVMLEP
jgi:hypothetical protein